MSSALISGCGGSGGGSNSTPDDGSSPSGSNTPASPTPSPSSLPLPVSGSIGITRAFPNLSDLEVGTLYATHAGDGSNRLFVVLQNGVVRVFENNDDVSESNVFLDISTLVSSPNNGGEGEEGLLGLAFAPDYSSSGQFYVYYSASSPRRSVVARYQVSANDVNQADQNSGEVVLEVEQPFGNHNGGWIGFGADDFLYIALGDGGSQGDPQGNSQNRNNLLGSILRIDPADASPYRIPSDNPFVGIEGARDEIWAYGFRNPWRCSFDQSNNDLWCGDVGQSSREEVDIVQKGGNYGWNIFEGSSQFSSGNANNLEPPLYEYSHSEGQSITGGYVYRGAIAQLQGSYVYGDFATRRVWMLNNSNVNNIVNEEIVNNDSIMLSSFAEDETGEVYLLDYMGMIYRFTLQSEEGNNGVQPSPTVVPNPASLVGGVSVSEYFQDNCATCHGSNRQGIIGPSLLPDRLSESDQFYFNTIRNGRVNTPMPAIDVNISDEEINTIIRFLRTPL